MIVKELIEQLQTMPQNAEVVTAKDPKGAWTILSNKVIQTKYDRLDICILVEGYP
jgi:hypothetical protein